MRRHIAARLIQSLVVVLTVTTISFFMIHSLPGDPFSYGDARMNPVVRAVLREAYGYNKPLPEQYVRYVTSVSRGEFGYSYQRQQYVSRVMAETVPRTLLLAGLGLALSMGLGTVIGVLQATHRGGWFDRISSTVLIFFYSLPDFWGALMILLLFAYWMPMFPPSGIVNEMMHDYMPAWEAIRDRLLHLVLPVVTFTILTMAGVSRYQRAALLETLPSDYVRTARAKGLSERQVIWRHAFRNSLTPMITLLGLMLPGVLGGALFIERVFGWPGMGSLAASSIEVRDYDVVMATVIVGSVMVVVGNLAADVLQLALDPRTRE